MAAAHAFADMLYDKRHLIPEGLYLDLMAACKRDHDAQPKALHDGLLQLRNERHQLDVHRSAILERELQLLDDERRFLVDQTDFHTEQRAFYKRLNAQLDCECAEFARRWSLLDRERATLARRRILLGAEQRALAHTWCVCAALFVSIAHGWFDGNSSMFACSICGGLFAVRVVAKALAVATRLLRQGVQ